MSIPSENIKNVSRTIDADPVGSDHIFHAFRAPRDLTILRFDMVSKTAQGAGTATKLRLENWGTTGAAVQGTVSSYVGGTATASQLAALTPATATIDTDHDYVEEGEWLVVRYIEEGAGWIANDRLTYSIDYVIGLGA